RSQIPAPDRDASGYGRNAVRRRAASLGRCGSRAWLTPASEIRRLPPRKRRASSTIDRFGRQGSGRSPTAPSAVPERAVLLGGQLRRGLCCAGEQRGGVTVQD